MAHASGTIGRSTRSATTGWPQGRPWRWSLAETRLQPLDAPIKLRFRDRARGRRSAVPTGGRRSWATRKCVCQSRKSCCQRRKSPLVVFVQTTRVRKVPHMRSMLFILATLFISSAASTVMADGPIIAFGEERDRIRNTPILERENRPFHFYGNTVRRMHARQQGLPMFRINSGSLLGR